MKSEAAKGLVRITFNYMRLGGNLLLGLTLVPFMLGWVGDTPYGLVMLLGAGSGFAAMVMEITDRAVVRELGAALHGTDDRGFRRIYNSALVVSAGAALLVLVMFGVLLAVIPLLKIDDPALLNPARVLVITQGCFVTVRTLVSPIYNMQVAAERFVGYNFWMLMDRASYLGAAILVRYGMGVTDPAQAIITWAITLVIFEFIFLLIPLALIMKGDARTRPAPFLADRESVKEVFATVRWYVAVEVSNNLYERAGMLLTNLMLDLRANTIFGIAVQFVSYISQLSVGMTLGMEAVSARLGSKGERSLQALVYHSTRLLGLVALPAGLVFFVMAPALIRLWIGRKIQNPSDLPLITVSVQIMCVAVVVRSIVTGWTTILYGAGFLRRYAPVLLIGALFSPILSIVALKSAPDQVKIFMVPTVLTFVYSVVTLVFLPRVAARCLQMHYHDLFTPLWRPFVATAVCSPVILLAPKALERLGLGWTPLTILAVAVVFGCVFGVVSARVVLDHAERERFLWSPLRRLSGHRR